MNQSFSHKLFSSLSCPSPQLTEVIKICRLLIVNNAERQMLVSLFTKQWQMVLGIPQRVRCMEHSTKESSKSEKFSNELNDDDDMRRYRVSFQLASERRSSASLERRKSSIDSKDVAVATSPWTALSVSDDNEEEICTPMFTVADCKYFTQDLAEGSYIGVYITERYVDIVLLKYLEDDLFSTRSATYHKHSEDGLECLPDCLVQFVKENELQYCTAALSITLRLENVKDTDLDDLKRQLMRYPVLSRILLRNSIPSDSTALLVAAIRKKPAVKFAVYIGERFEISLTRKIATEDGRKIRKIATIGSDLLFTENTIGLVKSGNDVDYIQPQDLLTSSGLPETFRKHLIAAIDVAQVLRGQVSDELAGSKGITLQTLFDLELIGDGNMFQNSREVLSQFGYEDPSDEDCMHVKFVCQTVIRRSCTILAACLVAVSKLVRASRAEFVIAGPLIRLPMYSEYLCYEIKLMCPKWLQINVEVQSRRDVCIGAALIAANEPDFLENEELRLTLPPFRLECCSGKRAGCCVENTKCCNH